MAMSLSADQEAATKAFLDAVSESGAAACVSRAAAVRFLLARKFDVARAHALWRQHEATRRREGLNKFEPFQDPLKTELATGKFTILPSRDATGAAIAVFTANKHFPTQTTHQITLQGVVYQLDAALQSLETQRAGLVFIYDMSDSKYTNFDYELSQKILALLKGGYPAKLKKVLIVTAPLWFKAPFRILRLFVREKLRERVHTVSAPQLGLHVPRAALPRRLGGQLEPDHAAWLEHCRNCFNNSAASELGKEVDADYVISNHCPPHPSLPNGLIHRAADEEMTSDRAAEERLSSNGGGGGGGGGASEMHISGDNDSAAYTRGASPLRNNHGYNGDNGSAKGRNVNSGDEDDLDISTSGRTTSMWCSDAEQSSGFSDEECGAGGGAAGAGGGAGVTPAQLLARVRSLGRRGLIAEYEEQRARPPAGTFHHSKLPNNLAKNRYTDVLCYDHSRVTLAQADPADPCSDYINANYVDGYKQKNAFICTQGPLPKTYGDFWRMVWEQHTLVVVMTTRATERGRIKCGQYWCAAAGQSATHGDLRVHTESVHANQDFVVSELLLTNLLTEERRSVWHWQYVRWPDYGVPGGGCATPVLEFLHGVRTAQASALAKLGDAWAGHSRGPPIVVHCSAGIGRTGTFLTLDICISRLEAEGVVDVRGTVERIRSQRAYSIQMPDQYVFCHLALFQYAVTHGYMEPTEMIRLDEDTEEESE